ncbi:TPA: glycosyltransferase family 4 protein [Streptococcus pneumoniae]|nr:glycosyltransferase family 4 protein [Streptococcus pneumoniae]
MTLRIKYIHEIFLEEIDKNMKKVLIVRSGPYQVNPEGYNLQELGLASAISQQGYQCDVMYYHKTKNYDQLYEKNGEQIKIFWRRGIRLFRSGIYPQILREKFLNQYDKIIISEYSQIMAVLLSRIHSNVYIYNGSYYNLFKIPIIEPIYDFLFVEMLNKRTKTVFCKTEKAECYLKNKGFNDCKVVGVGLDIEKFEQEEEPTEDTIELLRRMENKQNILYVGSLSKRKNTAQLIRIFNILKSKSGKKNELQLVLIGKDEDNIVEKINYSRFKDDIIYQPYLKNSQLQFIYPSSQLLVLPSVQEIFGMVLLEAMYFKLPVVSSASAGGETLIQDGINGKIVNDFNDEHWVDCIENLLNNPLELKRLGECAHKRITEQFMWSSIARKIIETFDER